MVQASYLSLLLGLLVVGSPLNIADLAGEPPQSVALQVGPPAHAFTTLDGQGNVLPLVDTAYDLAEGGRLEVTYCYGRAASFFLSFPTGAPTPQALLGTSGIPPGTLVLTESGPGYMEWGRADRSQKEGETFLLRVQATQTRHGWSQLAVDYGSAC